LSRQALIAAVTCLSSSGLFMNNVIYRRGSHCKCVASCRGSNLGRISAIAI
jgi:hypothetical protein